MIYLIQYFTLIMKQFLVIFFLLLAIGTSVLGYFFFKDDFVILQNSESTRPDKSYGETQEEKEDDINRDALLYNSAIEKRSKAMCEQIKDIQKQEECIATLIALEAISLWDITLCDTITSTSIQITCRERIIEKKAQSATDKSICDAIAGDAQIRCKNTIDEKKLQVILANGNITKELCDSLETTYKAICMDALERAIATSISSNAISASNTDNCDEITTENEKDLCYDTVNLKKAFTTNDITECTKIIDDKKKEYCISTIGRALEAVRFKEYVAKNDLESCASLTTEAYKVRCEETIIFTQVRLSKNTNLCGRLPSEDSRATCEKLAK